MTTVQEHEGWTKNDQQQEPKPKEESSMGDAEFVRMMAHGTPDAAGSPPLYVVVVVLGVAFIALAWAAL